MVVQSVLLIPVEDSIVDLAVQAESGLRLNLDHLESSKKASRGTELSFARSHTEVSVDALAGAYVSVAFVVLERSRLIVLMGDSVTMTKGHASKQVFARSCRRQHNLARPVARVVSFSAAASRARHSSGCSVGIETASVATLRQALHTVLKLLLEAAVDWHLAVADPLL